MVLEVRRGEVRLGTCWTLVWALTGVFQHMQLQAVVEVEPRSTLHTLVRFAGAVDRALVVVQSARRRKRLFTLVTGHTWFSGTAVRRQMSL